MKVRCVKCGHESPRFETEQEFVDYYRSYKYLWIILTHPEPFPPYEQTGICPTCMTRVEYDEEFRDYVERTTGGRSRVFR